MEITGFYNNEMAITKCPYRKNINVGSWFCIGNCPNYQGNQLIISEKKKRPKIIVYCSFDKDEEKEEDKEDEICYL